MLGKLSYIKGTVSKILSDPPCKAGNAKFTSVPINLKLIKKREDIVVFLTRKFLFSLSLSIASYNKFEPDKRSYTRHRLMNKIYKIFVFKELFK